MVYSGAKRGSQLHSYNNGDFGGGVIKAGLPYQVGRTSAVTYAFRQTSQNLTLLRGRKNRLYRQLQEAIANLANKQAIADNANTAFMDADAALQSKYDDVSALYEGAVINDDTDINAMLDGLTSPDDDAKINALNAVLTARTSKSNAQNTLNQANLELSQAQTLKDATQTEYDNA